MASNGKGANDRMHGYRIMIRLGSDKGGGGQMRRDAMRSEAYWNAWIEYNASVFKFGQEVLQNLPKNPEYPPSFLFEQVKFYCEYILRLYSRGDPTGRMSEHFYRLIEVWEAYDVQLLAIGLKSESSVRLSWSLSFDYYIMCFWLVGWALALDVSDEMWCRLVRLVGNEGEDILLDSIISKRQPFRKVGSSLCYPKAYAGLLEVVLSPPAKRGRLLHSYLDQWYVGLHHAGCPDAIPRLRTPYWYDFGSRVSGGGAYFGYWCVEAIAVVVAYRVDDRRLLNHPNYPGDFLKDGRCPRYAEKAKFGESLVISW